MPHFVSSAHDTMRNSVILAVSELIGGHTEYVVHAALGVPSLRSLWGAVRNRQLYILLMYSKSCNSFNFSIFLIITSLDSFLSMSYIFYIWLHSGMRTE